MIEKNRMRRLAVGGGMVGGHCSGKKDRTQKTQRKKSIHTTRNRKARAKKKRKKEKEKGRSVVVRQSSIEEGARWREE